MSHATPETKYAPKAIGPYVQATVCQNMVFLSGQLPLDPTTQQLVEGDIKAQMRRALENLLAVLKAAGGSASNIVKTTLYLTNLDEFADANAVYAEFFTTSPPARATVQVAALPKGASVEVDAIAILTRNS